MMLPQKILIRGTQINYYFICKTKLWLFSHFIHMESTSDLVSLGKLLHEASYSKEKKEEIINNEIAIDFIRKGDVLELHEVKKSNKMEKAHYYQMLYYLYYLDKRGIKAKGFIDYPKLRKRKEVVFTDKEKEEIEKIMMDVESIVSKSKPPKIERKSICKKCAYYDFCFSGD